MTMKVIDTIRKSLISSSSFSSAPKFEKHSPPVDDEDETTVTSEESCHSDTITIATADDNDNAENNDRDDATTEECCYKPIAGSTSIEIDDPNDAAVDKKGNVFAGWRQIDPSTVQVRGVGYSSSNTKSRTKVNSPGDLYKCVKVDVFESDKRYPNVASRVELPRVEFENEGEDNSATTTNQRKKKNPWFAPDVFVITAALPTAPPSFRAKESSDDGPGYTIVMYCVMQQETRDILRKITAADDDGCDGNNKTNSSSNNNNNNDNKSKVNAVRLLEKWCREAPTDDSMMSRFKVIPRADNPGEIGLPSWISKFNGKPFLIKRPGKTGFLFHNNNRDCGGGENEEHRLSTTTTTTSYMEFDVSLHPFPYVAKKGLCYMKDSSMFPKTITTFAFCLEGRDEDELPECVLGAFQLCRPDPKHAIRGEDFFAGTHTQPEI